VVALGVFALLGYWVDRHWDVAPWGLVIGALLGLIGGGYNLIRESFAAFKPPDSGKSGPPPST
jgi:F0F1-type ATP synthase assembly protein I